MSDRNVFVRLADVEDAIGTASSGMLDGVERFTLTDGRETNEAGVSELRDDRGLVLYHDGKRRNHDGPA